MLALVFAAMLANGTVAAKPASPAPGVKDPVGIGRFIIQDGTENASWLVTRFRESLWQNTNDLRALNGQNPIPLEDYLSGTDYATAKKMLSLTGEWTTGNARHTWVFQKPGSEGGIVESALELQDLSGPEGYHLQAFVHCYDEPERCKSFREKQNGLLAPKPAMATGELAMQQWRNRVYLETCIERPVKMDQPRYPAAALRENKGGNVFIGILFNRCGNVRDSWLLQSSGHRDLDRAALVKVLEWQLDLKTLPAEAMEKRMAQIPIRFEVGDSLPSD
jgi:TonB family protein